MGIGDFVSDITPDSIEDAIEDGTEWVGDRVEDAGDWTADRLDDVGWESGADWVRENSRSLANQMGAQVDEMQLGETEDKTKLVYGSPDKLRSTATNLRKLGQSFTGVGNGLKGLDSAHLKGAAANAFRDTVSIEPPKWFTAADAFVRASSALDQFAGTVTWAQGQAQLALDKFEEGMRASDSYESTVNSYNDAVDRYNAQPAESRDPSSLPPKPGSANPGIALMNEAQEILGEARRQRNSAADTAAATIRTARDAAPPKPSYGEQAMDGLEELQAMQTHFTGGIVKGAAGIISFARSVNPTDPYNLTHPAEYVTNLNNTAAGLVQVANDPWGAGRQMVTDFMKDPAEGLGRLVPDLALTAATGGGGAAVKATRLADEAADLARLAEKGDDLADAGRTARRTLDDDLPGGHDPHRAPDADDTDPVDLATGRMFLPQTDVVLPGVLPLAFTRRVESGYRAGRFFGPAWSSTVDERLEVDAAGVIHVTAEGKLRPYPHPVPGTPTRPEHGPVRSRLERAEDGDYRLTDPDTGLVKHFAAPPGAEPGEDGTAWLAETADRNGNRITVDRAADGTPQALAHSAGYHLKVTVTDRRVTALALAGAGPGGADQPVIAYEYDDRGDLVRSAKTEGSTAVFAYDDRRRMTGWTDSNGRSYSYTYDDRDRVVAEGGESGHYQLTIGYGEPDPVTGERITTVTTAAGHTTRHRIDDRCRTLAITDALGHTTRFSHDAHGRVLTVTDPLGRTTAHTYDDEGLPRTLVLPDGGERRMRHNELGLPVELTAADGSRSRREYDERGNCVAAVDPAGRASRYTYDGRGRLVAVTPPGAGDTPGPATTVRCDEAGLPLAITDELGGVTRYTRDGFGRPTAVTDPTGATTLLRWTVSGRLVRRTYPDGTAESWTHDGQGNCTSRTDRTGLTTRYEYGPFDVLTARTDPDGVRHTFEHDAQTRLTRVTNAQGATWAYTYDAVGRVVSETDFDGRTVGYTLDAAGQLTAFTTPLGEEIRYERDELGRVTRKDAAGAVFTYAYDPAGRLAQATGPDAELICQYDRTGRIKTELVNGRAMTYRYDERGRRVRRVTPSGSVTAYTYDETGRLAGLTAGGQEVSFTRDVLGRELRREIGDTLSLATSWDDAGRLAAHELAAGERTLNRRAYTYRADGHVTGIDDTLRGPRRFDLDESGRVTGVTAAGWSESYAYDEAGNQTAASWPDRHADAEAQGERAYTGTRITRAGRNRYEYDGAGRLVLRTRTRLSRKPDTWRYAYDAENRLTSVATPDGVEWRYAYDPLGRRIAKRRLAGDGSVAEETDFTWDGSVLCEQTSSEPGTLPHPVTTTWDHQGRIPLTQTERMLDGATQQEIDRRFFAVATDLIGTPTELVSADGEIAWHTRSTLWGTTTWNADARAYTPLRFPGQYYDPETGLHYNHHRYYDPATARYTTPDPLGLTPAPNPATYVHNPHTWIDPLGLTPGDGVEWVNPDDINFTQRSVSPNNYAEKMIDGRWDWERPGVRLHVMEVDGQLVSYDNRRLDAARAANEALGGEYRVPVERVGPDDPYPGKRFDTWGDAFHDRMHKPINSGPNGEPVPRQGLNERPEHIAGSGKGYPGR
ncbi:hypothetical protein SRB5_25800 [Streptomyces sp. RB5]|uniref:Type IV secretion protein Rhs n=1 Tax=Streptomyces smaragdinus TaxID=2585196 RepID=A0A7K0CGC4_9ACTN|nr:RHS repeat-associated core domain-containing protein [Streptomyces smaragdinus]MQY12446.1 hypothetical protein [Streptomyces smaragdinus]